MANISKVTLKTNHVLEELLKDIWAQEMSIKVGLVAKPEMKSNAGDAPKKFKNSKGKTEEDASVDIAYIASVHEFGDESRSIPQRSFLRSTFNEKIDEIGPKLGAALKAQLKSGNHYDPQLALRKVGVWMVGQIKRKFTRNDWPPLKNPSKRRVGIFRQQYRARALLQGPPRAPKPLIDTGQLRASIDYELVKKIGGGT
jgi:hypothetical protein